MTVLDPNSEEYRQDVRRFQADLDAAAAKAVTPPAKAATRNGPAARPYLETPKAFAKAVTQSDDSLSTDERLRDAALWPAMGCRLGSTVTPERVAWLWEHRLALGKLGLLEGDGGEGKSLIECDLAARLSAGLALPDDSPNPFGRPVPVVLMMAEDGDEDTVIPRVLAAGGNPAYVVLLKAVPDQNGGHFPTIPDDVDHLWHVCKTAGARALFVDPGAAYLAADVNSHNDHSVRRALARFPEMAADVGMAVVWVRHLNKNPAAEPKYRGNGSGAFLNLARTALVVGPSPDDDSGARRILAVNKINLETPGVSLAYHVETAHVRRDEHDGELVKTARVVWEGPSTLGAADILAARPDPDERTAGEVCRQLVQELLAGGPQPERAVWKAINQARISESTYRRVRRTLRVQTSREGGLGEEGQWLLSLPERPSEGPRG